MAEASVDTDGIGAAVAVAQGAMQAAIGAAGSSALVTLSLEALGAAPSGAGLTAQANVTRQTRTLAFVSAHVTAGQTPVASVDAVYRLAPDPAS